MSVASRRTQRTLIDSNPDDNQKRNLRLEELRQEVSALEVHLAQLEQTSKRSSPMFRAFGRQFGFGAAGKIGWVHFKLSYMRAELVRLAADAGLENQ